MRKLLASIASLMLVLTLWSGFQASTAYAAETVGCITIVDGDAAGHTPGDADEVPGDSDKATPHHHNVNHSHELGVPVTQPIAMPFVRTMMKAGIAPSAPPVAFTPNRNLRPPIA
ncbi:hypothetical protein ACFQ1E_14285 [Sphingomonas canadensis]|uniref:Uncharacterized protein n=1 Tax=Sphingomonas canadensis TaxID=1219257 RepID=A0ABW3H7P2_9SPHN|nr:hypothetical protein [Sphingomonas canadensis]MCW3837247.1 hypothetical protein [Sphingomonas canadensis]